MLLALFFSCSETEKTTTDTSPTDTATDTAIEEVDSAEDTAIEEPTCFDLEFFVEWQETGIALSLLSFDEQAAYYFGLAQTKPNLPNQWTGEDCYQGYTYETESYSYCHPARSGLTLQYGASYESIIEGYSTHFAGPQFANEVTYIIKDAISGCCWVAGIAPEYYEELDCTTIALAQPTN